MADEKQHAIKLKIGDCKLHVSSQTTELGEAGESIVVGYEGQKITAGFNAIEEDEILFEFKTGDTQAQFSVNSANCDRCLAIVMPMRL